MGDRARSAPHPFKDTRWAEIFLKDLYIKNFLQSYQKKLMKYIYRIKNGFSQYGKSRIFSIIIFFKSIQLKLYIQEKVVYFNCK